MTNLLIGWPNHALSPSSRPFSKFYNGQKYGNLSRAEKYQQDGHLITFAPTGSGKGVGVIIPNLLHYSGPVITIDPKGENFCVTAKYRKDVLRQRIFLLDPFETIPISILEALVIERASLNPLDLISSFGAHIETQLTMIATILAGEAASSTGEHRFWDQEAQKLLAGVIGAAIALAGSDGKSAAFQSLIDRLFTDDVVHDLAIILDRDNETKDIRKKIGEFSYKAIAAFLQKADKERSGVMSTVHSYLTPFLSRSLNSYLSTSSISPQDLSNRDDYTLYIVIPPSKLVSHAVLLRLWISTIMNTIMERGESPLKRTLFLLDECAQLGALGELRTAVTLLRGYGLQVWMFFQDLSQLQLLYEDWETMIHNCGVLEAFGLSKHSSAVGISNITGTFTAAELTRLDRTQKVVLESNMPCRIMKRMNYLTDAAFRGRFRPNLLFAQKRRAILPFPPKC